MKITMYKVAIFPSNGKPYITLYAFEPVGPDYIVMDKTEIEVEDIIPEKYHKIHDENIKKEIAKLEELLNADKDTENQRGSL